MRRFICKKHGLTTHTGGYYLECGCEFTVDSVSTDYEVGFKDGFESAHPFAALIVGMISSAIVTTLVCFIIWG